MKKTSLILVSWIVLTLVYSGVAFGQGFGQGQGGQGGFPGGGQGGQGGQGLGLGGQGNTTTQTQVQSPGRLPTIMNRASQGVFGSRTLGAATRQRYRGFMGSSQAGSGGGQYASSGAFRSTQQRSTLPGTGLGNFSSFSSNQNQNQRNQGQFGGQNAGNQQNNRNRGGGGGRNASNAANARRTTVKVGFDPPARALDDARFTALLGRRLSRVPSMESATVTLEGRTLVLKGTVATEHARQLAERLVLLEPGIDVVKNELTMMDSDPPSMDTPIPPPETQRTPDPNLPPVTPAPAPKSSRRRLAPGSSLVR